jgi:hypothetical protein
MNRIESKAARMGLLVQALLLARPDAQRELVRTPRHAGRQETRTKKTKETRTTSDGKEEGGRPDIEDHIEITYE